VGLVRQTKLNLSKEKALVQLGHLSSFYAHDLEEIILVCILGQNNSSDIF